MLKVHCIQSHNLIHKRKNKKFRQISMLCFAKYEARNEQPNILGMIVFQRAQLRFVYNIENVCVLGALHSI